MAALTSFHINTVDRNDHSHSMRAQRIHDSDDDGVCDSNSLSATGSQQPTANSKQPPGGADDDGGGDDGGDGYDDDDVISRVPRFQVRAPPRERYPVDYQTVSSRSTGSAQKQGFRRAETPFHAHETNREKKTLCFVKNRKRLESLDIKQRTIIHLG